MIWAIGTIATCLFELRRSLTLQRLSVMAVLSLFPPAMLTVMRIGDVGSELFVHLNMLIVLLVSLVCILSLLLWATPNVYSELEGKSWIFIASRPRGRTSLLLGKYLAAVIYSFGVCEIAISLCILIAVLNHAAIRDVGGLWSSLSLIFLLGCLSYGAVFSLIGTIFFKRAMVVGAIFVIVVECILGMMPALISKFTLQYHLRSLGIKWIGWFLPPPFIEKDYTFIYGQQSQWFHLTSLATAILFSLTAAMIIINWRQFITSDES